MFQTNRVVDFDYHGRPRRLKIEQVGQGYIGGFEEYEGVYKNFRIDDQSFVIGVVTITKEEVR